MEEVPKPGTTLSLRKHNLMAKSAAMRMVTRIPNHVARFLAKSTVRVIGQSGVNAALTAEAAAVRENTGSPCRHSTEVLNAPSSTSMLNMNHATLIHAPSIAKELGVHGVTAHKSALTAATMAQQAPVRGSTPCPSSPSTVGSNALIQMARSSRRLATRSAAQRIAKDPGVNSVSAPHHVEMVLQSASMLSHTVLPTVVRNAQYATRPATPRHARAEALAPSIVPDHSQNGRSAMLSAAVVRKGLSSFTTAKPNMVVRNASTVSLKW